MSFFNRTKQPYPRSFARRLTWRIMLTVIIVMGAVSFWFFYVGWTSVVAAAHYVTQKYLEGKKESICRSLSEVQVASINTVPRIEENLDKPERMYDIMENMVRQNPSIRSCGISFAADYYPEKGRWFCPYASRDDDDSTIIVQTIGDKQHDYLEHDWFVKAMTQEKGFWSKPFFDGQNEHTPLVSWLLPIRNQKHKTVAVLGVDLSLNDFADKLGIVSRGNDVEISSDNNDLYVFVIDGDGTYLVHPDSTRVVNGNYFDYAKQTPDTLDDHLGHMMVQGFKGFRNDELLLDGEEVVVEYMPIDNADWSAAWVIPSLFLKVVRFVIDGIFIFLVVLGLLIVFFAGRRSIKKATKSLKQLAASADEVAKGNFNTPLPSLNSRDEIHQLRDSFEKMQLSLTAYIDELKTTTAQKASMESELKVAHDIQMSMLPKTFPPFPNRSDIDVYGTLTPAKEVGGDLFDFFIRDEQLFFCIGDVSGKGVPASLVMAVTRSLFRNVSSSLSEPHRIANALNLALADSNETSMFVTLFVGVLDLQTGHMRYCNAGHDAPLVMGHTISWLPCDPNIPIGVMPDWEFTCQEMAFHPQTTLFLYTDGLNEAEDIVHAQFGQQRITDVAETLASGGINDPVTVVNKMSEAVAAFVGEAEQSDDLTMLAIKFNGKQDLNEQQ